MAHLRLKRIYDAPDADDGYRILVDALWPRGITRERAALDEWARDLAPSDALRRWFSHDPAKFDEFRTRYCDELASHHEHVDALRSRAAAGPVTLLYAARDPEHNNAVVLAQVLRSG